MPDKYGCWIQPLTPIPCAVCGRDYANSGRYANRSTVCRYCRQKIRKAIREGRGYPAIPFHVLEEHKIGQP
jgi:hypothetical protein